MEAAREYDSLKAERDELKRRCEKIAYRLRDKPDEAVIFVDHNDIVAMAEGRHFQGN